MQYLPTSEEQDWLIAQLGALIAQRGIEPFAVMPIVEPTPRFFPDEWTFSREGLDRLVRRLLQYAGLGDLDVVIRTYEEAENWDPSATPRGHRGTAGLFMELSSDGSCLFAFNEQAPADAEYMAGVMAHEVAHAYRARNRLVGESSRSEEEWLTDLTAVYLGFGLLAANNSYRYRTEGWTVGALACQTWTSLSTGYLTPQAFAYLLAIQIAVRDLDAAERRRLLNHLEPNQAVFTKEALKVVLGSRIEVIERIRADLGVRGRAFVPPDDILRPLPAYVAPEPIPEEDSEEPAEIEIVPSPVFRVPKNRVPWYLPLGMAVGSVVGAVAAVLVDQPLLAFVGLFGGAAWGVVRGARACSEVCSDPRCGAVLGPGATCPGCGVHIAGTLQEASDLAENDEGFESGPAGPPVAHKIRRAPRSTSRPT